MTISKEVRQTIYNLADQGQSVKNIFNFLKSQNLVISEKSVQRICKEDRQKADNNASFVTCTQEAFEDNAERPYDEFADLFKDEEESKEQNGCTEEQKEERNEALETIQIIKDAVKEETQKILTTINQDISQSNDKLDTIIRDVKKNCNKPINMTHKPKKESKKEIRTIFDTEDLTEEEKRIRRDLIVKIRNYLDCFADYQIIEEICGSDLSSFKQSLYEKNTLTLNAIYEEIQLGLNQSKDFEQFMNIFSTGLKGAEFVSSILLGINLSGLRDEVLSEIDEFDLRQLACELSLSRYISPQQRIMLITLNAILKRILTNGNLINLNSDLKAKLYGYYKSLSSYLRRGK